MVSSWHNLRNRESRTCTFCSASTRHHRDPEVTLPTPHRPVDALDRELLALFSAEPRIGVLGASRRLQVARGTVQARLDRLERDGVVTGWEPSIAPAALGYGVTAFVTLEITQHAGREALVRRLDAIPELLECWTVTGSGDLWCRIVAHSNTDLQRVIDQMVVDESVIRASTLIALAESIPFRTGPLLAQD